MCKGEWHKTILQECTACSQWIKGMPRERKSCGVATVVFLFGVSILCCKLYHCITMEHIVTPVIESVPNVFLRQQLLEYFPRQVDSFTDIKQCFHILTSGQYSKEKLRCFFHSWSMTNNSAMTVSGIANRLTLLLHKNKPVQDPLSLLHALTSLHRIVDEDLGVVGGVLHKDLYYRMATHFCGDDDWLSLRYLTPESVEFKKWKDANSLRDKDIVIGLLTTIVHEIYTHGEVEYILPLFKSWMQENDGLGGRDANVLLAWIIVHTGPTEKNHFFHAIHAVEHYARAMDVHIEQYDMEDIIRTYMQKKAATMNSISQVLIGADIAVVL